MSKSKLQKQFSNSLQKGLGKAFNYLIQNNSEEFRCDLLNACLHNLVSDPQCEQSRAEWLFELINLTNDLEYYRQNILQALPNTTDYWDIQQLYDLAAIWAKKGCQEARQLIYDTLLKTIAGIESIDKGDRVFKCSAKIVDTIFLKNCT